MSNAVKCTACGNNTFTNLGRCAECDSLGQFNFEEMAGFILESPTVRVASVDATPREGDEDGCPWCGSLDISHGEVMGKNQSGSFTDQSMCMNCGALGPEIPVPNVEDGKRTGFNAEEKSKEVWRIRAALRSRESTPPRGALAEAITDYFDLIERPPEVPEDDSMTDLDKSQSWAHYSYQIEKAIEKIRSIIKAERESTPLEQGKPSVWLPTYSAMVWDALRKILDLDCWNTKGTPAEYAAHAQGRKALSEYENALERAAKLVRASEGGAQEARDWQPIETAPKDGTQILLTHGMEQIVAFWDNIGWWSFGGYLGIKPTHWRLLPTRPAPPVPADNGGKEG